MDKLEDLKVGCNIKFHLYAYPGYPSQLTLKIPIKLFGQLGTCNQTNILPEDRVHVTKCQTLPDSCQTFD